MTTLRTKLPTFRLCVMGSRALCNKRIATPPGCRFCRASAAFKGTEDNGLAVRGGRCMEPVRPGSTSCGRWVLRRGILLRDFSYFFFIVFVHATGPVRYAGRKKNRRCPVLPVTRLRLTVRVVVSVWLLCSPCTWLGSRLLVIVAEACGIFRYRRVHGSDCCRRHGGAGCPGFEVGRAVAVATPLADLGRRERMRYRRGGVR